MKILEFAETDSSFQIIIEAEGCHDASTLARVGLTALKKMTGWVTFPKNDNTRFTLNISKKQRANNFIDL